jgi:hypothetical protein
MASKATTGRPHTFHQLQRRRADRAAQRRSEQQLRAELESYATEAERMELQDILRRAPGPQAQQLLDLV